MNAAKLKAFIVFGVILLFGSGILVFAGIMIDRIGYQRLKAEVSEFSTSVGVSGTLARERKLEGGSIKAAFSLKKKGTTALYVLYQECRGFSGKAGFLAAFTPSGAFRASTALAIADASLASAQWPSDESLLAAIAPKEDAVAFQSRTNPETSISLRSLGAAIYEGRAAIEQSQGGTK
jgi:hypothetical protein